MTALQAELAAVREEAEVLRNEVHVKSALDDAMRTMRTEINKLQVGGKM